MSETFPVVALHLRGRHCLDCIRLGRMHAWSSITGVTLEFPQQGGKCLGAAAGLLCVASVHTLACQQRPQLARGMRSCGPLLEKAGDCGRMLLHHSSSSSSSGQGSHTTPHSDQVEAPNEPRHSTSPCAAGPCWPATSCFPALQAMTASIPLEASKSGKAALPTLHAHKCSSSSAAH